MLKKMGQNPNESAKSRAFCARVLGVLGVRMCVGAWRASTLRAYVLTYLSCLLCSNILSTYGIA